MGGAFPALLTTNLPCCWPQVILGGGRKYMFPRGTPDPEYPNDPSQSGTRLDGRNLVEEWLTKHQVRGSRGGAQQEEGGAGVSGLG